MGHDGTVNDFLFTYLDSIDEQLLEYLDEDDELKLDAVKRLRFYTSALLEGSITPDHVMEDWSDWYQLLPAFVATYGSEELQELEGAAGFLGAIEEHDDGASPRPTEPTSRRWKRGSTCFPRCGASSSRARLEAARRNRLGDLRASRPFPIRCSGASTALCLLSPFGARWNTRCRRDQPWLLHGGFDSEPGSLRVDS
jgi:hypothetical protein